MEKFEEAAVKVPFAAKSLDAALCYPAPLGDAHTAVILTHGAGGDMNFKHLVSLARYLAAGGVICMRFTCKGLNLGYRVKAYCAAWDYLKSLGKFNIRHIFVGGRSMGCRAAAALARQLIDESDEEVLLGVICLSFPLHPPGQAQAHQQRGDDLRALPSRLSVLFVSGTEDTMCDRLVFDKLLKEMKGQIQVFWVDGGSHGLTAKGKSEDALQDQVNSHVLSWIKTQT